MDAWIQKFTILDRCYCFLAKKKVLTSLDSIIRLAAHVAGKDALLESHIRQMVSIGVVELAVKKTNKLVVKDDFNPNELPETMEMIEFSQIPQSSKKASMKRTEMFRKALEAYDIEKNAVPEYEPKAKRIKKCNTWNGDVVETVDAWIHALVQSKFYTGQLVHVEKFAAREAKYGSGSMDDLMLDPKLIAALKIQQLYSHQYTAIDALMQGNHVAISTSTSSGKSMVYNIPVTNSLLQDEKSTHLYLFPTKALAQDQQQSLESFLVRCGFPNNICATYDGDTSHSERSAIRKTCRVFLTNPDMLHITILPQHKTWQSILSNLKFIVIDESHMYRGLFGSHVAWILRRLLRLCLYYGSSPQVVCCSASIDNPEEHFHLLIPKISTRSRELTLVQHSDDGAPCGRKAFAIWNPLVRPSEPEEHPNETSNSAIFQSAQILSALVQLQVHTIAFCRGRKLTELVLEYTLMHLRKAKQFALVPKVKSYRGGYVPEDRRAIESELFNGELLGVVATNALELGIDIGNLECTIHVGFPSSISSLWQQAGRAGRSGKDSLAIIVGFNSPLDHYYLRNKSHCSELFTRKFEAAVLDPLNEHVMTSHLQCASLEIPLFSTKCDNEWIDRALFSTKIEDVVKKLCKKGQLLNQEELGYRVPALHVVEGEKVLDTVPNNRVFLQLYPSGVYLYQGREYLITRVDTEAKLAFVEKCHKRLNYFTGARDFTDVNVSLPFARPPGHKYHPSVHLGRVSASTHVVGCYKYEKRTFKSLGLTEFSLPAMDSCGHGVWIDIPERILKTIPKDIHRHAVHGMNHLILAVVPKFVLMDNNDLYTEHVNERETRPRPMRLILYEAQDGGVGIVARVARVLPEIVACANEIIDSCDCENGCPGCIQSADCSEHNEALEKAASKAILEYLDSSLKH
ncbi:DEAD/DEAH box RNA helicase [Thraustotheca clavata]|uniref:DEAD/DEAH box RNA helicase n=1 Tax=Thraustotheca clavata TaxID=74557 RepID=A0A1W0A820_9STRA|nr:DEAD/DEAH box RNA helicase [Thraustotheca clavata]